MANNCSLFRWQKIGICDRFHHLNDRCKANMFHFLFSFFQFGSLVVGESVLQSLFAFDQIPCMTKAPSSAHNLDAG